MPERMEGIDIRVGDSTVQMGIDVLNILLFLTVDIPWLSYSPLIFTNYTN
ncbi:MAG: hypothetical protein JW795_08975 [Chitinivibrionales bacterium]|nr:hypothetical protein [Chitinivibrionales bacterium]